MKTVFSRAVGLAMTLLLFAVMPAFAQPSLTAHATLTLPVSGTFSGGGEFTGSVSINRFEQRENHIVAVGFVNGVLTRHRRRATAVAGELSWPVTVRSGDQSLVSARALTPVFPRLIRAQAQSCSVLSVSLAPIDVNLLGTDVSLGAIDLNLTGQAGTPLGDLVCAVSDLLGNVAGLVNVLNGILGLLTGLLGGLTGGLGGL